MTHEIILSVHDGWLQARCSCGKFTGEAMKIRLIELNDAVHEHIESEEATEFESPFVRMLTRGLYETIADVPPVGYGTKSAVTSEDELVDIETGLRRNGTW